MAIKSGTNASQAICAGQEKRQKCEGIKKLSGRRKRTRSEFPERGHALQD
jgi:hypothetical protein